MVDKSFIKNKNKLFVLMLSFALLLNTSLMLSGIWLMMKNSLGYITVGIIIISLSIMLYFHIYKIFLEMLNLMFYLILKELKDNDDDEESSDSDEELLYMKVPKKIPR